MTLLRMIVVLVGALLVMLPVVVLRAETTRLQHEIAGCEQEAERLQQQLRAAELELARLRNPMLIRQRVEQALNDMAETGASTEGRQGLERP